MDAVIPDGRQALIAKLDRAHKEICAAVQRQFDGRHALKMGIPARPDEDTDLIVCGAIEEAMTFLAALDASPAPTRKKEADQETRVADTQYDPPLATASENKPEPTGYRNCVHGRQPLGTYCQQCNPFRR